MGGAMGEDNAARRPGDGAPAGCEEGAVRQTAHPAGALGRAELVLGPVMTVPNLLSVLRLGGVPLFLWLVLGPRADGYAVLVLAGSGITDWLDGKIARWLNQYSRLGELLDPAVDRLYILATLAAFLIRGIVPWWVVAALVGRDLVLGVCAAMLRGRGYTPLPVLYLGKAATFNLLYAFPLLLLAQVPSPVAEAARALGYAFTGWGGALYLWTGVVYFIQFARAMRRPVPTPRDRLDRLTG